MKKKGHFLDTAGAAQTQPSSSWFFFPRTNHYVCMALGKNKSGRSKQFGISNTRTPDHTLRIQQHYHRTKCMHMVLMHVTVFWTQIIRIKGIKMAQRLARGLEPETQHIDETSITTTSLDDLLLLTVLNLLKQSPRYLNKTPRELR